MESVMHRTVIPLRASTSQAFVGLLLVRLRSIGNEARRSSTSIQTTIRCQLSIQTATQAAVTSLPKDYGYVILTVAATTILVQWQAFKVSAQRRKSGVPYPKVRIVNLMGQGKLIGQADRMYEDAGNSVFNCYQRAHQNTLENYPSVLALLAIGGLGYPITASAFGMIWVIGRVVYSLGYYTGDPKNRLKGMFHFFAWLGLFITCGVLGVRQTGLLPA